MSKFLYLVNLILLFFVLIVNSQDIPTEKIMGPTCVLQDSVTGKILPLPPEYSQYNVIVTDGIAHIEIKQLYVNNHQNIKGIVYVFPLPHEGSVHKMEMEYDNQLYKAEIYEKEKAQEIFDSVVKEGGAAALLIQDKPNIFQQRLANIAYQDSAVVSISVSMPLDYNNGEYELAIPTMVAPRYGDGTGGDHWNPPADVEGQKIQINCLIQTGFPITNLNSPSHYCLISQLPAIREELEKRSLINKETNLDMPYNEALLLAQADTYPNKDFILRFSREKAHQDFTIASYYSPIRNKGHFALNMFPERAIFEGERPDLEIILLIDVSGSQSGWPLEKEKEIANNILDRLLPADRFTVMSFEYDHQWLWEAGEVREATSENINNAKSFVNSLQASGGTELLSAVNQILSVPLTSEHKRYFVFLTDGFITNEEAVFARIKEEEVPPTIFTFGAGNNLNRYFLDQTAAISHGYSYEIAFIDNATSFAEDAWSKLESPQLKNITIDWGTLTPENLVTPSEMNLFKGRPITVYGSYAVGGSSEVTVKGYRSGELIEFKKNITFASAPNANNTVPQIWAKQKIEQLALEEGLTEGNKNAITDLSVEYQVLSKYTAFLAIKPEANEINQSTEIDALNIEMILKNMKMVIFDGSLQLIFPTDIYTEAIAIYDLKGRVVHYIELQSMMKNFQWHGMIDQNSYLSNGFYIMRIKTDKGMITKQFHWRR